MSPPSPTAIELDAGELARLHGAVTALAPGALGRPEHVERLSREIVAPLRDALGAAIAALGRLEEACDQGEPEIGEWGDHLEHTGVDGALGVASSLEDELWQQVGNLAFAGRSELRRAERTLVAAASPADLVVACESARRKLRRAIHAVLEVTGHALGRAFDVDPVDAEVEAAVAVRRMYAKFRRSLPRCDAGDAGQVRRALRYAAVSLAVMVGAADFSETRVQDRQLLLGLQARILAWARAGSTEAAGAQLYQDLLTAADLLRAINQRQELVAHDRLIEARLAQILAGAGDAETQLATIQPLLAELTGRDDGLDDLVARAGTEATARDVVAGVRGWLAAAGAYPASEAA